MALPHRRRPPITEAQIFEARETAVQSGNFRQQTAARDTWVFNRFSFRELAKALHERQITWARFVKLYAEIMDDPKSRPMERMGAADKLRECMGFVAVNTQACRAAMGIQLDSAGAPVPERPVKVKSKSGSRFAETFNEKPAAATA